MRICKTHNNTNYRLVINFIHWQEFAFHLQFYSNHGYLNLSMFYLIFLLRQFLITVSQLWRIMFILKLSSSLHLSGVLACHQIVGDRSVRPQVTWYTFVQKSPSSVLFYTFKLKLACANKITFLGSSC